MPSSRHGSRFTVHGLSCLLPRAPAGKLGSPAGACFMLQYSRPNSHTLRLSIVALLLLLAAAAPLRAQSTEASFPTPVFTNDLSGRIAPRDVGDPRRTRHFYIFRGAEGDLVVNLETAELIGDVDVFTAVGSRPLLKFTVL